MRRSLTAVAAAALIGLALFWLHDGRRAAPLVPAATQPAAPAPTEEGAEVPVPSPTERVEIGPVSVPDPVPIASDPPGVPEEEQGDHLARDWIDIEVLDPEGRPVFDAELSIIGAHQEGDRLSWYWTFDEPETARSDVRGHARISYERWVGSDMRTIAVELVVKHPEFVPFRESLPVGPGQHPVRLQRGSTVVVSAWYGSADAVVSDLRIQMEREAQLPSKAWLRELDGRLSTTQLSPGKHRIWVRHASDEHGKLASAIQEFELAKDEWKELQIELHLPEVLHGRLDDVVPRPVLGGHVMLNLHLGGLSSGDPSIDRTFEASVRADGTFELPDLPRGSGQIIALCHGWVSQLTRVETLEEAGIFIGVEEGYEFSQERIEAALQEAGRRAFQAQRVSLPCPDGIVVLMQPTGALEFMVRKPDGSPLAGAQVGASPNIYFAGVGSTMFPWREWTGTTDSMGRFLLEDLPPDDRLSAYAYHPDFHTTREDRDDAPSVEIVSGKTVTLEIVLEGQDD